MAPFIIATWNVNSLRARAKHVERFLIEYRPDVLCLQETKVTDDLFPVSLFESLDYHVAFWGQKSYNGVAICSLHPLTEIEHGFPTPLEQSLNNEARLISATIKGWRIMNGYFPNGSKVDSASFEHKLRFYENFYALLNQQYKKQDDLISVGDFNIAPEPIDVYDPDALANCIGFHFKEHGALKKVLSWGMSDLFRLLHPEAAQYTWWDFRTAAYQRNAGMRIDHILVTPSLQNVAQDCWIEKEERDRENPSDHVPVMARFNKN